MKRLILILFVLFSTAHLYAQSVKSIDTLLVMSDGKKLDALYVYPTTPAPAGGYPALVVVHGFGGSKDRSQAEGYARMGSLSVAYSVRGQGNSEGVFDFFTSPRIRGDLQSMIDFCKALPQVNRDRVGVIGGSQGGLHAWAAAAFQMGVRTVVSVVANGRFEENWTQNGGINWLFSTTVQTSAGGKVRFAPSITDTLIPALQRDDYSFVRPFAEAASTTKLETAVTTPTLILVSYYDQFFNPSSALRQFARIPAPKKIMMWAAGHATSGDAGISSQVTLSTAAWLEYWLKDNQQYKQVISPDSAVIMFDEVMKQPVIFALRDSAFWLNAPAVTPPRLERRRLYFSGQAMATVQPPAVEQRSFTYASGLGSTPIVFRSAPFTAPATLAGTIGQASILANSGASKYQVNLFCFDYDPVANTYMPLTKGHYEIRGNTTGARDLLTFDLQSAVHTLKAGHQIEVRVSGGIGILPRTNDEFGNVISGSGENASDTLFFGGPQASFLDLFFINPNATAVTASAAPAGFTLQQNYPNPFRYGTTIQFSLPDESSSAGSGTSLTIHDNLGREIARLLDAPLQAGTHSIYFDGESLPSGLYHIVLSRGNTRVMRQMVRVK